MIFTCLSRVSIRIEQKTKEAMRLYFHNHKSVNDESDLKLISDADIRPVFLI